MKPPEPTWIRIRQKKANRGTIPLDGLRSSPRPLGGVSALSWDPCLPWGGQHLRDLCLLWRGRGLCRRGRLWVQEADPRGIVGQTGQKARGRGVRKQEGMGNPVGEGGRYLEGR